MSNEIKKARMRQRIVDLATQYQIEICLKCLEPTDECQCEPVTVGLLMGVQDWRQRKEGLGAVRVP